MLDIKEIEALPIWSEIIELNNDSSEVEFCLKETNFVLVVTNINNPTNMWKFWYDNKNTDFGIPFQEVFENAPDAVKQQMIYHIDILDTEE